MKDKFYLFLFSLPILFAFLIVSHSRPVPEISAKDLLCDVEGKRRYIVLDVRNINEVEGPLGIIKNAIHIPLHKLEVRIDELNDYKSKVIAIVCHSGIRSAKAVTLLNKSGFQSKNVVGGMAAYRELEKQHDSKICCDKKD